MPIGTLQHYSLEPVDMQRTRDFYCDVLGLEDGFRPDLGYPGHWLYSGGLATVHLLGPREATEGVVVRGPHAKFENTGRLDHIAFSATDLNELRRRITVQNVVYRENILPDAALVQFLLRDPDGLEVELNFPYSEIAASSNPK